MAKTKAIKPIGEIHDPIYCAEFFVYADCSHMEAVHSFATKTGFACATPINDPTNNGCAIGALWVQLDTWVGGMFWFNSRTPEPARVAHECLHATLSVLKKTHMKQACEANEEAYTYYLEYLVREVTAVLEGRKRIR